MRPEGTIELPRKLAVDPEWTKYPFNKAHAWIDLLLLANPDDHPVLERGQLQWSLKDLARRWQWPISAVKLHLAGLYLQGKLIYELTDGECLVTIVNYDRRALN